MATISFDRDIIIDNPEAVKIIVECLTMPPSQEKRKIFDVQASLKRGEELLNKFSFPSKQS